MSAEAPSTSAPMKSKFGAKMMAKMGYVEGQGLGAQGRGRLAPIETQLRPQGIGLGAVKEKTKQAKDEEKREAAFRGEVLEDSEEEKKKRRAKLKKDKLAGRAGGAQGAPGRQKVKYRTAAEIEAQTEGFHVPDVLKTIIDATGAETKMLTSTAGLMTSVNGMVGSETEGAKLAKLARRDLEAFADEWRSLAERDTFFGLQESQLATKIVDTETEIRKLEDMTNIIQKTQDLCMAVSSGDDAWEHRTRQLESLEESSIHEASLDSVGGGSYLQDVIVAVIQPLFKSEMQQWEPLRQPRRTLAYLDRLKHLLKVEPTSSGTELIAYHYDVAIRKAKKTSTPYETLIHTSWFPPVQSAVTNDWDPHDPNSLITFVEDWKPVLPPFVLSSIISRLVPQRLATAIDGWQPRRHTKRKSKSNSSQVPPHTYLFPWFPHLPSYHSSPMSPAGIVADFKRKLKSVLLSWSIASDGVVPHLSVWQPILKGELSSLLIRYLLPRLASHLAGNFLVDPSDQDLSPLNQILQWSPHLPTTTTAHLLIAELFPKWHQTLHLWLTSEPNYDEIREWFLWWKDQLPADINAIPAIEAEWNKGLETITLALDLGPDAVATSLPPPSAGPAHPLLNGAMASAPEATKSPTSTEKLEAAAAVSTFRDVVEDWCASCDLMMIPLREADPASGMPLFRITARASGRGGVIIYLKGDVVWARSGKGDAMAFAPVELNDGLVKRAER